MIKIMILIFYYYYHYHYYYCYYYYHYYYYNYYHRGRFLIDDRPNNGAKEFGKITGQTWIHYGSELFKDWSAVLAHLDLEENNTPIPTTNVRVGVGVLVKNKGQVLVGKFIDHDYDDYCNYGYYYDTHILFLLLLLLLLLLL